MRLTELVHLLQKSLPTYVSQRLLARGHRYRHLSCGFLVKSQDGITSELQFSQILNAERKEEGEMMAKDGCLHMHRKLLLSCLAHPF